MKNTTIFNRNNVSKTNTPRSDIEKLQLLLNTSGKVLFKTSSVFPFDFFPDEICIDEFKISIISHDFFLSEDIHSIPIGAIRDVDLYVGPLFASLKIVPDGYPGHALEVHYLKRKDAIKARRLIEGLIITRKQGIDLMKLNNTEFYKEIEEIGNTHLVE